jgi:Domain of unknown function (DUF4159)
VQPGSTKSGVSRLVGVTVAVIGIFLGGAAVSHAQRIWRGGYGFTPPRFPTPTSFAGSFNFCRVLFTSNRREKQGWSTDYPGADLNFSTRLAELTKTDVKLDREDGEGDTPDAVVVRLTDDALFHCPFVLMEDAGTAHFSELEVVRLREFLLKGGFLLASDYHGTRARAQFDDEIGHVLPPGRYPTVDLTPPNHAMWNTLFQVKELPPMASIQTWRRTGGVLERWNDDRSGPSARGIADEHSRLMVVMLHNTDIPDGWEREGEDPEYFFRYSPDAYAVGIDVLLYSMTH